MIKQIAFLLCIVLTLQAHANDIMHVLKGGLDAKTLDHNEIDSLLNGAQCDKYRLEYENINRLFRHSFLADCYLVDTQKNTRVQLSDQPIRDAKISPNGKYVVYAKADNNLYIYKTDFKTEVQITTSDNLDIFNGISDWLYEEEFGITRLFEFSPDSKHLAFVRLNETDVPTFQWQTYLSPASSPDSIFASSPSYPQLHALRYPKAGAKNAAAEVCVYDIYYKTIRSMQLPVNGDGYLPRLKWTNLTKPTNKSEQPTCDLVILYLNRDQNKMEVYLGSPKSTVCHLFYSEESKKHFVNYEYFDQWQWLNDNRVIVLSEEGGYVQAYLYSSQGIEQRLLTPAKQDIMQLYGYDETRQTLYYQAATTPMTRQAYALNLRKNTTTQLTEGEGTHSLYFSKDMAQYIDCYHSVNMPHKYILKKVGENTKGVTVLDNDSVWQEWQALGWNEKEFFTITTERGDMLNAWRILPKDFNPNKKYPVVMMQYSGPTSQRVLNNWRKRFGYCLAQAGYLVVCADGRGTGARGREWRNATYMQLGLKEAEDQISVAQYLKTLPYVDADRMAICGWSYGGYQTLMCLSKQSPSPHSLIWKCGIAIAPVTNWKLYDSAYTERFMRRPQVNEFGYDNTDLMKVADQLQGNLLLVHGLADDNVHAQNSLLYIDALVKAKKQFEMQLYVDDNHSIRKPANYEHLHNRILLFLENNL